MREYYLREATLLDDMERMVIPYLNSVRQDGYFDGYDGQKIHYVKYTASDKKKNASEAAGDTAPSGVSEAKVTDGADTENASEFAGDTAPVSAPEMKEAGGAGTAKDAARKERKTVVISHGFTESTEKWHELTYYFLKCGWDVYALDHRGHGLSHRKVTDLTLTHIDNFGEYVWDFEIFTNKIKSEAKGDICLFAHSMGGAIGALFMENHPDFFRKAVLSSPMIAPSCKPYPWWLSYAILGVMVIFGQAKKRSFTSAPYPGEEIFADSAKTSEARFAEYARIKSSHPEYQNYSMTYGWALNAMKARNMILRKNNPGNIKTDIFMALAGHDTLVQREAQLEFSRRVPHCEVRIYEDAKHEIYGSKDEVAFKYFDDVLGFLEGA